MEAKGEVMRDKNVRNITAAAIGMLLWGDAVQAGAPGFCYDPATRDGYVCAPCSCPGDRQIAAKAGQCAHCGMDLMARKDLEYVAIVVYDGVALLDWSGPGGVFTAAGGKFYPYTVSKDGKPVTSQGFVRVDPEFSLHDCPWPDVLVIPGGGVGELTRDPLMMEWIAAVAKHAEQVLSVCSGSFVLAKAGMLDGLQATSHTADAKELERAAPRTTVHTGKRFVDNGKIITTAGIATGIDGALRVVAKLHGDDAARRAAEFIEYGGWEPGAGLVVSQKAAAAR
jgi:putative intracellular protease/amidase